MTRATRLSGLFLAAALLIVPTAFAQQTTSGAASDLAKADRRAPFMHDGSQKTLAEVVEHYDRGGAVKRPSLSNEIKPLNLTVREKAELVAFLKTLTSTDSPVEIPALPR